MAFCTNCGAELYENSKFCPECGTPVEMAAEKIENDALIDTEEDVSVENTDAAVDENISTVEENTVTLTDEALTAENILDSIPDIKKLDGVAVHNETDSSEPVQDILEEAARFAAEQKVKEGNTDDEQTEISKSAAENIQSEDIIAEPKKKSKAGIVILVVIIILIGSAAALYFSGMLDPYLLSGSGNVTDFTEAVGTVTEAIEEGNGEETYATEVITEVSTDTEIISTVVSSETENNTEKTGATEDSETTTESEDVSEAESEDNSDDETAGFISENVVFTPDHIMTMGNGISCEISLSEQGISSDMIPDSAVFVAEYTTQAENVMISPCVMTVTFGENEVQVTADSFDSDCVLFSAEAVKNAVINSGYSLDEIDIIRFRSVGAPVDVATVIINME